MYVADDADNEVRKISTTGIITDFAGTGAQCAAAPTCGDGGQATSARLNSPYGVAVDPAGDVLIADSGDDEDTRSVATNGIISRFAGTGAECASPPNCGDGGLAKNATLVGPDGVGVNHAGDVLIDDTFGQEVREVLPSGTIKRIAGTGTACSAAPSCGDGGLATSATLSNPDAVTADAAGDVFIADTADHEIREINSAGIMERVAGTGSACSQSPACGDGGAATSATFNQPGGLAFDPNGDLLVADYFDDGIRWLTGPASGPTGATGPTRPPSPPDPPDPPERQDPRDPPARVA